MRVVVTSLLLFAVGLLAIAILVTYPKLPSLETVQHYQPKMPLTIYSSDGKIIGMYGEERRSFTKINDFPQNLKNAVIAAEDQRFYQHWGVDVLGVARAIIGNITSGGVLSGASTITQQVAKNFYLSNERTFTRKFNEALLAYKIEQSLSKDQILELYFNQIYLGQRAYGFAAAAQIYFNKPVQELTLAEASMLAGLPKAPSAFNPVVNPERAKLRQAYILNNMQELGMITPQQKAQAMAEELHYERFVQQIDQSALYVAEMARQELYEKYGEDAKNRIIATTDKARGTLKALADKEGYETFVIPDDIGGRFSVITPVGLLPIAVAGIDIDALMKGLHDGMGEYGDAALDKNPAYRYAVARRILQNQGYDVELLVNYEPQMQMVAEWWKQLFGESEGKDGKGILPDSVCFSTDLHSLGQFVQEGKKVLFETNLYVDTPMIDLTFPNDEANEDGMNYLAGKSVDWANKMAAK